jgi:hypothetical protein
MQAERFDWKIDLAIVGALLLSAGIGIAFVFYRPDASQPDGTRVVPEGKDTTPPVRQLPGNRNRSAKRAGSAPAPDNSPSHESPNNNPKDEKTDPQTSPGADSPLSDSQPTSHAAAAHSRAVKTKAPTSASKKPVANQAPTNTTTPTRKTRKKN